MACLSKIKSAIAYNCDGGNVGLISALLINKEDIASITFGADNPGLVSAITLKGGASAYKIDTVKRTLVITEALKVNEGAPNAFTHSATVTVTADLGANTFNDLINPSVNGNFVVLTLIPKTPEQPSGSVRAYGLYYGMSATALDRSSHENGGWYTITMATPERVIGEEALSMLTNTYAALYDAAVG